MREPKWTPPEWANQLASQMSAIIRESPHQLLPFLEERAKEAEARGSYDELYVINTFIINSLIKRGQIEKAFKIREKQKDIMPFVSHKIVHDFNYHQTGFAELLLRHGRLPEATQEIELLLHNVPIGSSECCQILLLLCRLLYAKDKFNECVDMWLEYVAMIKFYIFIIVENIIQKHPFPNTNVSYPLEIKNIFKADDGSTKRRIANGCVQLCQMVLSSSGRYLSIHASDTQFLLEVSQWLAEQGKPKHAEIVKRCALLYQRRFEEYKDFLGTEQGEPTE